MAQVEPPYLSRFWQAAEAEIQPVIKYIINGSVIDLGSCISSSFKKQIDGLNPSIAVGRKVDEKEKAALVGSFWGAAFLAHSKIYPVRVSF